MDYFNDALSSFLSLKPGSYIAVCAGSKLLKFIKNTLICVPKMNEGLTGLEQHEGEKWMTEFPFWVNYPFNIFPNLYDFLSSAERYWNCPNVVSDWFLVLCPTEKLKSGLERHENEKITECQFLAELSL